MAVKLTAKAVDGADAQGKEKALATAMAQIEKQYGKGAVMRLGENVGMAVDHVSTGSLSLDMALGIGGYVKGTMSVDMDGISDNLDFVTADIPAPPQTTMRNQFQMDASTSRIFLKLVGSNTSAGDFTVYLESDFRGKNGHQYDLRLRQAFIQFGGWKVGKARTTFADAASSPPTIDFEGPSGSVSTKNTMIQYSHQFGKHWNEYLMSIHILIIEL